MCMRARVYESECNYIFRRTHLIFIYFIQQVHVFILDFSLKFLLSRWTFICLADFFAKRDIYIYNLILPQKILKLYLKNYFFVFSLSRFSPSMNRFNSIRKFLSHSGRRTNECYPEMIPSILTRGKSYSPRVSLTSPVAPRKTTWSNGVDDENKR